MFPIGTSDLISLHGLAVLPKGGGFSAARSISEPDPRGRITLRNLARACERRRVRVSSHGCSTRLRSNNRRKKGGKSLAGISSSSVRYSWYELFDLKVVSNHLRFRFRWQFISITELLVEKERKGLAIIYSDSFRHRV